MNTSFDWHLIPSFLAVLEHGSLLAAARALKASQPTLGRHISELEQQLGVVLFERTGRGQAPTQTALRLAQAARHMDGAAHDVARAAQGVRSELAGTVRISASQPVAYALLPPILARLRLAMAQIQVELVASNAVSNLLQREADIALRMVAPQQTSLIARRLGQVRIGAFAHRDYLERRGVPRRPADLAKHALIGMDQDDSILRGFAALGVPVQATDFALRSDDLMVHWAAIQAGLGIGFVARYLARRNDQVQAVLPTLKIPRLPLWLVAHRELRSSPRIRQVYDFLAQAIPAAL